VHPGELQHANGGPEGLRQGQPHRPRLYQQHRHPPPGGQRLQGYNYCIKLAIIFMSLTNGLPISVLQRFRIEIK